jgi:hypothetical protein
MGVTKKNKDFDEVNFLFELAKWRHEMVDNYLRRKSLGLKFMFVSLVSLFVSVLFIWFIIWFMDVMTSKFIKRWFFVATVLLVLHSIIFLFGVYKYRGVE